LVSLVNMEADRAAVNNKSCQPTHLGHKSFAFPFIAILKLK